MIAHCSVPRCTVTHAADTISDLLAGGWTIDSDGDPWCPDCTHRIRAAIDGLAARARVERPLVDYLPAWLDARTPFERRVVAYTAAALGDTGCAGYLAAALPTPHANRVEQVLMGGVAVTALDVGHVDIFRAAWRAGGHAVTVRDERAAGGWREVIVTMRQDGAPRTVTAGAETLAEARELVRARLLAGVGR